MAAGAPPARPGAIVLDDLATPGQQHDRLVNTAPIAVSSSTLPDVTMLHLGTRHLTDMTSMAPVIVAGPRIEAHVHSGVIREAAPAPLETVEVPVRFRPARAAALSAPTLALDHGPVLAGAVRASHLPPDTNVSNFTAPTAMQQDNFAVAAVAGLRLDMTVAAAMPDMPAMTEPPSDETPPDTETPPDAETPVDETPADPTPGTEIPPGETPVGQTPDDQGAIDQEPVDPPPATEPPSDDAPTDTNPPSGGTVAEPPVGDPPVDDSSGQPLPQDGTPTDGAPTDGAAGDPPGDGVTDPDATGGDTPPVDSGPVDGNPGDNGPVDNGPVDNGPIDNGPVDSGPGDGTPPDGPPPSDPPPSDTPPDPVPTDETPPDGTPPDPLPMDDPPADHPPVFASDIAASVAENATGIVYVAQATDPDAGTTLSYTLSGADAALFDIDASTGAVSFKTAPDYEAPADQDGDNVYDLVVTASDGTNSTSQPLTISVTDVNEAPVITSGTSASFAENATGIVYVAQASDPDAGTALSYSLSGADAALFGIDASTGAVSFKTAPDYEAPADQDGDNVYDLVVTTSDGTNSTSQPLTISVTDVNEAPVITSGTSASFAENATGIVYVAQASDPDAGTALSYTLGGADAALFDIDASTGAVSLKTAPDYEAPADQDGDNVYDLVVTASDGTNSTSQPLAISVTDVNEAPTSLAVQAAVPRNHIVNGSFENFSGGFIWNNDNYAYITATASGWQTVAGTVDIVANNYDSPEGYWTTTDGNYQIELASSSANGTIRQSIDGLNAGENYTLSFDRAGHSGVGDTIVQVIWNGDVVGTFDSTGQFGWNHEQLTLTAIAGSNSLEFREIGTDGNWAATRLDNVSLVSDAPELSVDENAAAGTLVGTLAGSDPDAGDTLTYALVDDAGGRFVVDPVTGRITVAGGAALDFETATSLNIVARVTDSAGLSHDRSLAIAINNQTATIAGTTAADTLLGTSEEDTVLGYNGDDVLTGGGGNDFIDGGDGTDIVVFSGNRSEYEVGLDSQGRVIVTDLVAGRDGVDTVVNVEQIRFADGTFAIQAVADPDNLAPTGLTVQAATPRNHLVNGSFEQFTGGTVIAPYHYGYFNPNVGGWETVSGTVDIVAGIYTAPEGTWSNTDGDYQIELASATANGAIRQTIEGLTADETYILSFDRAGHVGQGYTIVEVVWNGTVVGTYDSTGQFSSWTHEQLSLTAIAGNNVLEFREIGTDGNWAATRLDNVSLVSQTPELSVNENAAHGTLVGTIAGVDPNAGDSFSYALLDDAGGRFAIDAATGQISVADGSLLDYESATSFTIVARVTDAGGLTHDQNLTIAVNNQTGMIAGTAGDDTLNGTSEEDTILGYDGNDTINGDDGNDILIGGIGDDTMSGGTGSDIFVFGAHDGNDIVHGGAGASWIDTIDLHGAGAPADAASWYVELGDGSILTSDQANGSFDLGTDQSGVIHFSDGHSITFDTLERINWG